MENSKIEWTDHTFNPWIGCSKVSEGCKNCYAESLMDKRLGKVQWGDSGKRERTSEAYWKKPLQWNKDAEKNGVRYRVFCASLADVFEDRPELVEWRCDLFNLIDKTPNLDWLLLTKRPENVVWLSMIPSFNIITQKLRMRLPDNLWIGTSVENQEQAEKRIPELLKVPAKVRFLSMEPLLGPVDFYDRSIKHLLSTQMECSNPLCDHVFRGCHNQTLAWNGHIDWVIIGGESGPNARPMHPDWARSIRDQCVAAGVPFLFKQWGEYLPLGQATEERYTGNAPLKVIDDQSYRRIGKHEAGRLLDGRTWNQYPEVKL